MARSVPPSEAASEAIKADANTLDAEQTLRVFEANLRISRRILRS
jgi:hypothetical protein